MTTIQDNNKGTSSTVPNGSEYMGDGMLGRTTPTHPRIGWGAIVAGVLLTLSTAWLMTLLGTAIGVSILDASDAAALGTSFTIGTGLWMLLTALVAFFVGALLTAHFAESTDRVDGLLHGISLWSLTTVLMLVLTYWGIAGLLQAGASAVGSTINGAASTVQTEGQSLTDSGQALAESKLADQVISALKQQASEQVSGRTGSSVTESEARRAIEQIDTEVLKTIALHLIAGDVQAAKDALMANTTLSSSDIDTIVDQSKADVQQRVDEFQEKAEEVAEAASSYAQAALWATFVSSLLALMVSIAGGWLGTADVQRETAAGNRRRVD